MRKMWPCADGGERGRKRTTATTPSIVTSDSGGSNDEDNNGDDDGDAGDRFCLLVLCRRPKAWAAGMAMLMSGACIRTCPQRVIRVIRPVIRCK